MLKYILKKDIISQEITKIKEIMGEYGSKSSDENAGAQRLVKDTIENLELLNRGRKYIDDSIQIYNNNNIFGKKDKYPLLWNLDAYLVKLASIGTLSINLTKHTLYDGYDFEKDSSMSQKKFMARLKDDNKLIYDAINNFNPVYEEVKAIRDNAAHRNLDEHISEIKGTHKSAAGFNVHGSKISLNINGNDYPLKKQIDTYTLEYLKMVKSIYQELINIKEQ